MLTLPQRKQLHRDFWDGKLDRPLLGVFLPFDTSFPDMDIELAAKDVVEKNRQAIEFFQNTPDMRIPRGCVNFGPVFPAGVGGCNVKWDQHTCWPESTATSIEDAMAPSLNLNHPLWMKYRERFQALVDADFAEAMLAPAGELGPFDLLAAFVGAELLCMECLTNPESVANLARAATDFWIAFYDLNMSLLSKDDGVATWFGLFCPGKGQLWSEDFTALCGPTVYKDLVLPCDVRIVEHTDTQYIHVHSSAIECLDHILKIPGLSGIEVSNDPNGPPLEAILEWAREAYDKGKSVMLSNWERKSSKADVEMILSRIDPSRTIVTLDAEDHAQAELWQSMFGW
jgi:hypothetical protein